jgi:hypothetical protein
MHRVLSFDYMITSVQYYSLPLHAVWHADTFRGQMHVR